MRRVRRPALPAKVQTYLDRRAVAPVGAAGVETAWKAARQTQSLATVVNVLQSMMGPRQRCMYCVDSHGSDIDHFWPKSTYPEHAFRWPNMFLCCTECGRFKGNWFPLSDAGQPMLVDPSVDDPWEHLDFDPDTGNLTARYDVIGGAPSPKGMCTVEILQLDRREGMAAGCQRTFRRLVECVREALERDPIDPPKLAHDLIQADDHGLLGWCFGPVGRHLQPFDELRRRAPEAWDACIAASQ